MNTTTSNEHATTDRLSERAHESVDKIAKASGRTEERIRQEASDVEARVKDATQKTMEHSEDTLQAISSFIREKPLTSLGLAFTAGTILSFLRRH